MPKANEGYSPSSFEMGRLSWILRVDPVHFQASLKIMERGGRERAREMAGWEGLSLMEDGRRGHEPRKACGLKKLDKSRTQNLP